jgi:hypothetical protein
MYILFIFIIIIFLIIFNKKDSFSNLNPQGSIGTIPNSFNSGSEFVKDKWYPNNLTNTPQLSDGPTNSLNYSSVQSFFPFMGKYDETYRNNKIRTINSEGGVIGSYRPFILRPFDSVTAYDKKSNCKWPCYSGFKYQKWCNEENAIKYHGMRPLMSPNDYNKNLRKMFNLIVDRDIPKNLNIDKNKYAAVFCTETKEGLMSWLMKKISLAVSKMPEFQKNGPWVSEQFYHVDVQLYQFVDENGVTNFNIIFNLYNPLRSVATLVTAEVFIVGGRPLLKSIDFVNDSEMKDYMPPQNGFGAINGQNTTPTEKFGFSIDQFEPLGYNNSPSGFDRFKSDYFKNPNEFDWNYQNTLYKQKFNEHGFYSNVDSENINIEPGVPDDLNITDCDQQNLSACIVPRLSGISDRGPTNLNGGVKNVYNNPHLIYSANEEKIISSYNV